MRLSVTLMVALLLVGTTGAVVSTAQSSAYSMSSPGEIEIPARELTVDGDDYTVEAFGRVNPGDTVQINVSATESSEYTVYLYDRDLRIEDTEAMTGSDQATFSTDGLSPGSYVAAVYDGEILEIYPIVIQGYDLTLDASTTDSGEVTVDVAVADGVLTQEPPTVQVIFGDDARSVRSNAVRVGDGEYRATISTDQFEPDTYAVHGVVRGEQKTEGGDQVILAVSDRHEVQLSATSTPDDDGGEGSDSGNGGGQVGGSDDGTVKLGNAELLNETVTADGRAVVRVNLANTDPARGRITLNLTANGTTVMEEQVAVAASTNRTIYVGATFSTPGTYDLALGNRSLGTLTVTEAIESPTGTPTPEPTPTSTLTQMPEEVVTPRPTTTAPPPTTTSGDGSGFSAVVAALAIALTALSLGWQRRRR